MLFVVTVFLTSSNYSRLFYWGILYSYCPKFPSWLSAINILFTCFPYTPSSSLVTLRSIYFLLQAAQRLYTHTRYHGMSKPEIQVLNELHFITWTLIPNLQTQQFIPIVISRPSFSFCFLLASLWDSSPHIVSYSPRSLSTCVTGPVEPFCTSPTTYIPLTMLY